MKLPLWVCVVAALAPSGGPAVAAEPRILFPGQYHGDEVTDASGEGWLALVRPREGEDALVPVALQVDTVLDELLDEDGVPTGKRVRAESDRGEVMFLLRDVPGVRAGPAPTADMDVAVLPDRPVTLASGKGKPYVLALEIGAPRLLDGVEQAPCSLVVRRGARAQTLRAYEAYYQDGVFGGVGNDAPTRVVWAGDLNRDGALDLVVDLTDHYNVSLPTLFLSSPGTKGPPLVKVAQHMSVGC